MNGYILLKLIDIELYDTVYSDLILLQNLKQQMNLYKLLLIIIKMDLFIQDYFQQLLIQIQNNSDKYIKKCKELNIDTIFSYKC